MMRLSPLRISAYHKEIAALQAADELRLFSAVRMAFHANASEAQSFAKERERIARGDGDRAVVTIHNNEELMRFLATGGR